ALGDLEAHAVQRPDPAARAAEGQAARGREVLPELHALQHHPARASRAGTAQQFAMWPSRIDVAGGDSISQRGRRPGPRAARGQPGGGGGRGGGCPPISMSRSRLSSTSGRQRRSARVYGWAGWSKMSVVRPISTMRPAYITATRSAMAATMPKSWVTRMIATPG